jgi:DNA/RNA endonuclease G (NUC1)
MRKVISIFLALFAASVFADTPHKVFTVDNTIYQTTYDCTYKGYLFFSTSLSKDTGNTPRVKPFHQEQKLPPECRVQNTSPYNKVNGVSYDLGHGVSSNAWDDSVADETVTNSLVNVVPQESNLNRHGPWRQLEVVENCFRNVDPRGISVYGGALYEPTPTAVTSNGAYIPRGLWKIIVKKSTGEYLALDVPNTVQAGTSTLDKYLTSASVVQKDLSPAALSALQEEIAKTGIKPITQMPNSVIKIPKGCNLN